MNFRKYRVPFTFLVILAVVSAAMIVYTWPKGHPSNNANFQFPIGIPAALGAVSSTQISEQQLNTISVTGSGTASMQADEATITLGAQTQHESASEAVRLNAETMNSVIDAIKALDITEEDIKTVSYNVYPVYTRNDYNTVIGYRVVNMIAVETTDMGLIGKVIDTTVEEGANKIQGVSFGLSDSNQNELKKQSYLTALDEAAEKATLIAERLELSITGVLYVSESRYQPYQPYWDNRFATAGEAVAPTPIIEGKLSVSVTVNVIYTFV